MNTNPKKIFKKNNDVTYIITNGDNVRVQEFCNYDEAQSFIEHLYKKYEQSGIKQKLNICGNFDTSQHYKFLVELIDEFNNANREIVDPTVVYFEQDKQYEIVSKNELTPSDWRERPFVDFGPLHIIESYLLKKSMQSDE